MDDGGTSKPAIPTTLRPCASTLSFIGFVAFSSLFTLSVAFLAVRAETPIGHLIWSLFALAMGAFLTGTTRTILCAATFIELSSSTFTLNIHGRVVTMSWSDIGPFYASFGSRTSSPHVFCRVLHDSGRRIPAIWGWQNYKSEIDIPSWFGFGGLSVSGLAGLLNGWRHSSVALTGDLSSNIPETPAFDRLATVTIVAALGIAATPGWLFGGSLPTYAGIAASVLGSFVVGAPTLFWPNHLAWARRRYSWAIIDYLACVATVSWGVATLISLFRWTAR